MVEFKFRIKKWKLLLTMFLTGMFWCPVTLLYSVKNPYKAIVYVSKMGISVNRMKKDLGNTIGKVIPKPIQRVYHRYGISDTVVFTSAAMNEVSYKPQPSLFTRIGNGIVGIGKSLMFWKSS